MSQLKLILVILLAAILQVSVGRHIRLGPCFPDLTLITALFFSMREQRVKGLKIAVTAGLFKDAFSGGIFGLSALSFGISCLIIKSLSSNIYRQGTAANFFFALLGASLAGIIHFCLGGFRNLATPLLIVPEALYTAVLAPPLFVALSRLFKREKKKSVSFIRGF